jgi:hypothetical protein
MLTALVGPVYFGLVLTLGGWVFSIPVIRLLIDWLRSPGPYVPPGLGFWCTQLFGTLLSIWGLSLICVGICDVVRVWRREQEARTELELMERET